MDGGNTGYKLDARGNAEGSMGKKRCNLWEWASQCGAMLSIKNESLVVGVVRINVG